MKPVIVNMVNNQAADCTVSSPHFLSHRLFCHENKNIRRVYLKSVTLCPLMFIVLLSWQKKSKSALANNAKGKNECDVRLPWKYHEIICSPYYHLYSKKTNLPFVYSSHAPRFYLINRINLRWESFLPRLLRHYAPGPLPPDPSLIPAFSLSIKSNTS